MARKEHSLTEEGYEYRSLYAKTWGLFRGDTSQWEDRFFFREMINQYGGPVLDVGCGTGRLLLDYMLEGVDIDGVDVSPEMLALCREKASQLDLKPRLFQQSMQDLDLPRRYRTIMVPSSSFQLVTDLDSARKTMGRFYQHLEPGGFLIMPFMLIWKKGTPQQTDWEQDGEEERPEDGAVVRRWSRARYDAKNQLEHTETRFEVSREGEIIASEYHARSPATRWYSQTQARDLYHQAGFTDLRMYRGFSHEPATEEDAIFSVVGMKP
jgi:ubiquinone/menaquinone biosynthesis C-methylase UbiE